MAFLAIMMLMCLYSCKTEDRKDNPGRVKTVILDAGIRYQKIDGFGVNITPAQWRDGNLKPAIDMLADDLGCTLYRFDCTGLANWLDPARRNSDGTWPEEYLEQVYTSPVFSDAWETYRYLQSKGAEPFFNVSGRIPPGLGKDGSNRLTDYDGYAEMVVTLLWWAREKEGLKFTLFAPFNEVDLGYPEGPDMEPGDCYPAVKAIVEKMKQSGLGDVKLIVMDDSWIHSGNLESILDKPDLVPYIYAFGGHTYGDGGDQDGDQFFGPSSFKKTIEKIEQSPFKGTPLWITEYGDLDQTGEVEYLFAWKSTRRLLKVLNDGAAAALAWDAFDNFHEHDTAWAIYGLLKTDTTDWSYSPRRRYFAARQVYRFVPPGFIRTAIHAPEPAGYDVYKTWHDPLKNMLLTSFVSEDNKDFTIVGMSNVECDVELTIQLEGMPGDMNNKVVSSYRTSRNKDCVPAGTCTIRDNRFTAIIKEGSVFTLTSLTKGQ